MDDVQPSNWIVMRGTSKCTRGRWTLILSRSLNRPTMSPSQSLTPRNSQRWRNFYMETDLYAHATNLYSVIEHGEEYEADNVN